jgi:MscS family membrane protein
MPAARLLVRLTQVLALVWCAAAIAVHAQKPAAIAVPPATAVAPQAEIIADPLGRHTPRGTVTGFLEAARKGDLERAAQYLNFKGQTAQTLARELFDVLDARLPARLMRISDAPQGSGSSLTPNQEIIGTIEGSTAHDIVLERVTRGDSPPIWLFSRVTLDAVPALHDEIISSTSQRRLPSFLITTKVGSLRLLDLLAMIVGLPAMYLVTVLLNRALTALFRRVSKKSVAPGTNVLPLPARLLLVTIAASAFAATLPLSLSVRQLWFNLATVLTSVTIAWLLILTNAEFEGHLVRRLAPSETAASSLLRLLRRGVDALIVFAAVLMTLRQFGIDPTPALAGLGVGGIAVALAAQKTLENVIAGASLIFDKAVRIGDFMKMGDVIGTVDHIGLRSTRIRTLDRTLVSVPNSQIANASLETLSARDKFWFHPIVPLRLDTTPEQLQHILEDVRRLLSEHERIDPASARVRFFRLGAFSLDIEVFAYLFAIDWDQFLEMQEGLLTDITRIVSRSGTAIAFPSQTMYVDNGSPAPMAAGEMDRRWDGPRGGPNRST